MIIEANYGVKRLRIIFQTTIESTALRREYGFLYASSEGEIDSQFMKKLGTLPNECGEITFSGDEFLGLEREIKEACMAAYLTIPGITPRIPIIDFLSVHFFAPPTEEDPFTTHSKSMEVTFHSLVDKKATEAWAKIDNGKIY